MTRLWLSLNWVPRYAFFREMVLAEHPLASCIDPDALDL